VNRELLEVRNVNLPSLRRIKICVLSSRKRPLNHGMRNMEAIGKGPVAPLPAMSEKATEDVDVRTLDHSSVVYQVSIHDTEL
jgi:hypothetical protein